MNLGYEKLSFEEIEISFKHIIAHCLKKIPFIIVCVLVFSAAIPTIMYVKEDREASRNEMDALTESEKRELETYYLLERNLNYVLDYAEESPTVNMDFRNVYQEDLQFYVEADENTKNDVANAIVNYVNSPLFAEKFSERVQSVKKDYVLEIVYPEPVAEGSGIVVVGVIADDEINCNKYADAVIAEVEGFIKSANDSIGSCQLRLVQNGVSCARLYSIYKAQMSYRGELNTAQSEVDAYLAKMNTAQLNVISNANENGAEQGTTFSIKYMLLGAVVGLFLAAVYVYCSTVFGGKLQTELELYKRFAINNLGILLVEDKNKVSRWVNKLLYSNEVKNRAEMLDELSSKLQMYLSNAGINKVCLIGTSEFISSKEMVEVCSMLEKKDIKCEILGNIIDNKEIYHKIKSNEHVILVETIAHSKIKEIYKEVNICMNANTHLTGYISIIK